MTSLHSAVEVALILMLCAVSVASPQLTASFYEARVAHFLDGLKPFVDLAPDERLYTTGQDTVSRLLIQIHFSGPSPSWIYSSQYDAIDAWKPWSGAVSSSFPSYMSSVHAFSATVSLTLKFYGKYKYELLRYGDITRMDPVALNCLSTAQEALTNFEQATKFIPRYYLSLDVPTWSMNADLGLYHYNVSFETKFEAEGNFARLVHYLFVYFD